MKTRLQFEFLPPSVNAIWRYTRKNGKPRAYRTEEYNTWYNSVGFSINRQAANQPKWSEPIYITIAMRRPRTKCDVDNKIKGFLDLAQSLGIIENDNLVDGVNAYWSKSLPEGVAAELVITSASSPLSQRAA